MTRLLHGYVDASEPLTRLQQQVARLSALQKVLDTALPPPLASACRITNLKTEELIISTHSSAVAVRLRQLTPSLLTRFAQAGHIIRSIRIKLSPAASTALYQPTSTAPERHISSEAKAQLTRFAATLPAEAPLRLALERLAQCSK